MAKEKTSKLIKKENLKAFPLITTIILTLYALTLIIPLIWTVISSLKTASDFGLHPLELPRKWRFDGYVKAWTALYVPVEAGSGTREVRLVEMFGNSLFLSIVCVFTAEISRVMCAYTAAKFRHHKVMVIMHQIVVILMIVALPSSLASTIRWRKTLGLYDSMIGEAIINIGFTGINFLYYYSSFKGVSTGYMEAARIDGAGEYRIFFGIMFPMIRNTFMALFILSFITNWNNYEISLTLWPSHPVVAYGLYRFKSNREASTVPLQLAACTLVIIPTLTLFLLFKNKLIGNLALGGMKG